MKKIFLIISVILFSIMMFAQSDKNLCKFNILVGAKYTPIDYIGGGIFGITITKNKFSLSLRNDFSMSVSRKNGADYFGIDNYRIYNYINIHYRFHKKIDAFLGYGWISNANEIHRLNKGYGYNSLSVGVDYHITERFLLEMRGDLPFADFNSPVDQNIAFPASIGLAYSIE